MSGRSIPANELDFQNQLSNPAWGHPDEVAKELQESLVDSNPIFVMVINEQGKVVIDKKDKQPVIMTVNKDGHLVNQKGEILADEEGSPAIFSAKRGLWGLLSYYTRDLRLGNLKGFEMFNYCQYYLDLAGDCLQAGYNKAFMTSLSKVITVLELSQSINGFFRRRSNTLTNEQFITSNEEPQKKKNLFKLK